MEEHGTTGILQTSIGSVNTVPAKPRVDAGFEEWEVADSFIDYDEDLIRQFYYELMEPSFPQKSELEPLENFTIRRSACPSVEQHVLIYFKRLGVNENGLRRFLILGGVIFEFFISVNCGLITYMLVNKETRGKGLARKLLNQAVDELDNIARTQCSLAGCNAIFLETNSSTKVDKDMDIMDPRVRHAIYHHMGLRLLNIAYVQPPLSSGQEKCNTLLLCVFLSPKIPSYQQGGELVYYIPASTVRNFWSVLWKTSVERGRLTREQLLVDVDYKRANMQLARQEKIRLLDLPWDRPWYLVELSEGFDQSLLHRFYNELVAKHTPPEALEDINIWVKNLVNTTAAKLVIYHVLLALRDPDDDEFERPAVKRTRLEDLTILEGGATFEYYPQSNCGLISYFVVRTGSSVGHTPGNVAGSLLERVLEMLHQTACKFGHLAGCNAIFMECSITDNNDIAKSNAVNVGCSHTLMQSLGFGVLDLVYAQPPLSAQTKSDAQLNLTVYTKDSNLPRVSLPYIGADGQKFYFLPTSLVSSFVKDYWRVCCSAIGVSDFNRNLNLLRMRDQFRRRENIPLFSSLPWESAWSFVDLRTDYSADLLHEFYKVLSKRKTPTFDLQPINYFVNTFAPPYGSDGPISTVNEGLHVLLAISYAESQPRPVMAAGVIFDYFQENNCALIYHTIVLPSKRSRTALLNRMLQEVCRLLDLEATSRGHLAGCNAVFMLVHPRSAPDDSRADEIDVASHHQSLCDAGVRMLDLDFVLPPFRFKARKMSNGGSNVPTSLPVIPMLLSVLITPRIPQNGIDGTHYLPNRFISQFVATLWRDILSNNGLSLQMMEGVAYQQMLAQIRIRNKVPLVVVPWDSPFLLLDIAEDYDYDLLRAFFRDFVIELQLENGQSSPVSTSRFSMEKEGEEDESEFDRWHETLALPNDEEEIVDGNDYFSQRPTASSASSSGSNFRLAATPNTFADISPLYSSGIKSPPITLVARKFSHVVLGLLAVDAEETEPETDIESETSFSLDYVSEPLASTDLAKPAALTKDTLPAQKRTLSNSANNVVGGIVFDYFPAINVGLINHLAVAGGSQLRLCRELLNRALEILETSAHEAGFLNGCDAIFMEAKAFNPSTADLPDTLEGPRSRSSSITGSMADTSVTSISSRDGISPSISTSLADLTNNELDAGSSSIVQDILTSHPTLHQLGWRLMDIAYEPPPGSLTAMLTRGGRFGQPIAEDDTQTNSNGRPDVLLLIYLSHNIPGLIHADREVRYLPSSTLANFLRTHWRCASKDHAVLESLAFRRMFDQVDRRENTPIIMELPWETPVIVLDMKTDYSAELVEQFYRRFNPSPTDPHSDADPFEPLELWQTELCDAARHTHLLLAVKYHRKNAQPVVVGGMFVSYLVAVNCGVFARLNMTPRSHQQGLATLLLEEGEALLDIEASEAGHIAGCHVILIETYLRGYRPSFSQIASKQQSANSSVQLKLINSGAIASSVDSGNNARREYERCSQILLHSHQLIQFLDFEYLPGAKLGVYRTDRIPKRPVQSQIAGVIDEIYFLPAALLIRVLKFRRDSQALLGLSSAATVDVLNQAISTLTQTNTITLKPLIAFL